MSSKISGILNRNYYTIAHDLNPSENKEEKKPDAAGDQNSDNENSENVQNQKAESEEEIEDDPDEADHLEKGGGKLEITVENPEKTQVRMYIYFLPKITSLVLLEKNQRSYQ